MGDGRRSFPHIGQRIVKTAIAVFICLAVYSIPVLNSRSTPTEAAITAIICMQHYAEDTRRYALNRFSGTLIGAVWGVLLLLLLSAVPALGADTLRLYALMALGVLLSLYSTVLLRRTESAGLAAIVFLCIVIAFPDVDAPLRRAALRVLDVFVGTLVAVAVNLFRLPRRKNRDLVFFVRTADLVPDRFAQIPPAVLFRLNCLYNDGARICLMSEHAPAFFALQLRAARLNIPLIVMDGAALYDAEENVFLDTQTIPEEESARLREHMDRLGLSYFIYTVHRNKTCIFHHGEMTGEERSVYEYLRRSPYRSYLEGEVYDPAEIVYFKLIAPDHRLAELEHSLSSAMPRARLRTARRPQSVPGGVSGLYIYSHAATMEQARKRLTERLREEQPGLEPVDMRPRSGASTGSERDALILLHRLSKRYEPLLLFGGKKRSRAERQ